MSQNTSNQVRSPYTGGDTSEVRSVREEQLGVIGRDILKRSMSIQRDLYEERIQELEDEISRLKEVKKGSFQVWLRIRPSLDCKRLVSSSFRRTNVTIDQNLYRVHHVFGPESADEPSTSKPVDAHLASNTEVWEKWDKQVQAAVLTVRPSLLLCLGGTGSGKTETLIGRPRTRNRRAHPNEKDNNDDGLIPRTIHELLQFPAVSAVDVFAIEMKADKDKVRLWNLVGDLDKTHRGQAMTRGSTGTLYYTEEPDKLKKPKYRRLANEKEMRTWLELVKKHRKQEDTSTATSRGNSTSSRSHLAVLIKALRDDTVGDKTAAGSIWILDLAGNEDFDSTSERRKETTHINGSLANLVAFLRSLQAADEQKMEWETVHEHYKNDEQELVKLMWAIMNVPWERRPRVVVLGTGIDAEEWKDRTMGTLAELQRFIRTESSADGDR